MWHSKNESGFWAQHAVHLAEQTCNVGIEGDLMNTQCNINDGIHEEAKISEFTFVEFNSDVSIGGSLACALD
jgi:hypothetical protein